MKRTTGWDESVRENAKRTTVLHRNRFAVVSLTMLTVILLTAGLFANRWFASVPFTVACYAVAAASCAALVAYLYRKQLRIMRPPKG